MDPRLFLAIACAAGLLVFALVKLRSLLRQRRWDKLRRTPLAPAWRNILRSKVPLYNRLPDSLKPELEGNIQIFLDEKHFYGRAGLKITDEIRLTVAGTACMLLLGRAHRCFPGFRSILIYPRSYYAPEISHDGTVEIESMERRSGESWHLGPVILAWDEVVHGSEEAGDGFNVVLHEFAHKLDEENSLTDGLPILREAEDYPRWLEALGSEYETLVAKVDADDEDDVIDSYGATSPAEFFAVCTESFFEKPREMRTKLPQLYQELSKYYALDPASW